MSFTAVATKGATGAISAAQLQDLEDNIDWFRRGRSTFLIRENTTGASSLASGSFQSVNYNIPVSGSEEWHTVWLEGSSNELFESATDILSDWINLGKGEPGIWACGFTGGLRPGTGDGEREIRLRRTDGTTNLQLNNQLAQATDKAHRFHAATVMNFTDADYAFQVQVHHSDTTTPLSTMSNNEPAHWWGLHIGSNGNSTLNYAPARITVNDSPIDWWNNMANNQNRLDNRPAARIRQNANQSLTSSTWTYANMADNVYETDDAMVGVGAAQIIIQQAGYYWLASCLAFSGINTSGNRVNSRFTVNGSQPSGSSTGTGPYAINGETFVENHDIVKLEIGDIVRVQAYAVATSPVLEGQHNSYLAVTMVAGDPDDTSAEGQKFVKEKTGLPPAAELPSYADMSTAYLPHGYMNVLSDVMDYLWAPLIVKRYMSRKDGQHTEDGKWKTVSHVRTLFAPHGVTQDDSPIKVVNNNGGFKAPYPGLVLAISNATIDPTAADDEDETTLGDDGLRGLRHVLNGQKRGQMLESAPSNNAVAWHGSIVDLFVVEEGDEIDLQVKSKTSTDQDLVLNFSTSTFVYVGDSITATP
ncbi:MAG: hypothetical protein HKN01_01540 [Acidimicrobiia bacterium]|nr:hypothetical protein [Acidimicrobiia bacterium]